MDIDKMKSEYKKEQTKIVQYYLSELTPDKIYEKINNCITIGVNRYTIVEHRCHKLIDMNYLVSTPLSELNIDHEQLFTKDIHLSIVDIVRNLIPSHYDVRYGYGRTTWSDIHYIEIYDVNQSYCHLF